MGEVQNCLSFSIKFYWNFLPCFCFTCGTASGRRGTSGWGEPLPGQRDPIWSLGTSVYPWICSRHHHLPSILHICCLPLLLGQGHHLRGTVIKAEPFSLHSLLIFLSFWLCFRSKILFAGRHQLVSLAPGQCACLKQSPHQGQEQLRPSAVLCESGRGGMGHPEGLPRCRGLSGVFYFTHVKYGSDFSNISLFNLPKARP